MEKRRTIGCMLWLVVVVGVVVLVFMAKELYWSKESGINNSQNTNSKTQGYRYIIMDEEDIGRGQLILVNNSNLYKFTELDDMVSIIEQKNNCYMVKDINQKLNKSVMEPLNRMLNKFTDAQGQSDIIVTSGYRSFDDQATIYSNKVVEGDDQELQWVAVPGGSEHHTGYALDFGLYTSQGDSYPFDGKGIYSYVLNDSYRYGFILRYPQNKTDITGIYYEAWHFRYVGHPHAYLMKTQGMCLEEYIEYLKSFNFDGNHLYTNDYDGTEYEIYYIKAEDSSTQVPVPESRQYTISGNNVDGFIVTSVVQ